MVRLRICCWWMCVLMLLGCERRSREGGEPATRMHGKKGRKSTAGALVETRKIWRGNLTALDLELKFSSGHFEIEPDTTAGVLADLRFEFEHEDYRPEIVYDSSALRPSLSIRSHERRRDHVSLDQLRDNRWHLKISPQVVLDFQLEAGAIDGWLDFSGLRLEHLNIEVGAGELDLAFDRPNPERPRLSISAGAAATSASGLCNANFSSLEFHGGAGKSDLHFDGAYAGEGRVDLKYGVGFNTVFLTKDVGARIRKSGSFLAPMSVHGFVKEGEVYYSKNYEQAPGRLDFDIEMGVGHTTVKWLD